jgi:hypothetical protein
MMVMGGAMSRTVTFTHNLGSGSRARVRFVKERGRILAFVVQLECLFDNQWHPVIRYDTAHDFAHCDVMWPNGTREKTALSISDYNQALTFAHEDIKANWRIYRDRYQERWLEQ